MGKLKWGIGILLLTLVMAGCGSKNDGEAPAEPTVTQEAEPTMEPTAAPTKEAEPTAEPSPTPSIKEVLAKYNMKTGTCLSDMMIGNKQCVELITGNFNSITLENHLKPDAILNQKESKAAGDLVVKFNAY